MVDKKSFGEIDFFFRRVAETGHRDIQLRKFGREQSPEHYTSRYRKDSDYSCEKEIKKRGASVDMTDSKHKFSFSEKSYLQEGHSKNYVTSPQKRRYSSNNFEDKSNHFEEESEVLELVLRFLGPNGRTFYQTILMMLMFVGLIAYTQVFVSTFILQIYPGLSTIIPSLLFGLIAVPLSCIDLAEQISIQVFMSILRFVSLATLLFGTVIAMFLDPHPPDSLGNSSSHSSTTPYYQFSGFGLMFTTAIFSQLFQHSVPGLIRPLQVEAKRHVSTIFSWALFTTGSIYILIGIACVLYFGSSINQAINLNFVNYYWGLQPPDINYTNLFVDNQQLGHYVYFLFIKFLSMLIVLFPALDTLSVFPLIANTLGNNFHAAFPKAYKRLSSLLLYLPSSFVSYIFKYSLNDQSAPSFSSSTRYTPSNRSVKQLTLRLWRLFVSLPPILISIYVTNLSLTLQIAGVCGVLVALVIPALLQYYSLLEVPDIESMNNSVTNPNHVYFEPNPYSGMLSHVGYIYFVLFVAIIALGICIYQIMSAFV
jgi:amino acid permease